MGLPNDEPQRRCEAHTYPPNAESHLRSDDARSRMAAQLHLWFITTSKHRAASCTPTAGHHDGGAHVSEYESGYLLSSRSWSLLLGVQ